MTTRDERLNAARELGREHARNAASWATDGNTDPAHARRVLRMLDDGDPQADDFLPARPNLSGEHADSWTPDRLFYELTGETFGEDGRDLGDDIDRREALCDAYEEGVSETFESACAEQLRKCADDSIGTLGMWSNDA